MNINWEDINEYEVVPGIFGKFHHTETMTIVKWRFVEGAELPIHNHFQEQITMIESGQLELLVDKETMFLKKGDILPIKSMIPHGGKAISPTIVIDVFSPVREDFKEKFP